MIGKIKDGGLNMPDFKIMNKSLKAGWVKRFLNPQTQSSKTILSDLLHHVGGPLLLECKSSLKTLPELSFLPLFPRRLKCLGKEYFAHSYNKERHRKWDLWNNHLITIGGKSIFCQQWYNAGVKTLSDILDEEGNFLSFPEFRKKYKIKTNFLRYFGLFNAIPKYWKEVFNHGLENESVSTGQSTHPLNIILFWTCRQARSLYVSKTFQKPTSKARLIKAGFTDQSIAALYNVQFKITKNIKLLMFQFKTNHHILYTRDKLFRAKIIKNGECQLCGVRQALEHLFVECRHVQSFWNHLASWWNSCNLPKVALMNKAKIYAHHPEKRSFRAVNLCLIVARYYIYTAARESESYSITAFKVLLKSKLSTESLSVRASVSF